MKRSCLKFRTRSRIWCFGKGAKQNDFNAKAQRDGAATKRRGRNFNHRGTEAQRAERQPRNRRAGRVGVSERRALEEPEKSSQATSKLRDCSTKEGSCWFPTLWLCAFVVHAFSARKF